MKGLCTFLLGAAVGAVAAALLTPTTGEELRARIKGILQKHGIIAAEDIDEHVEMIACQIEDSSTEKKA